MSHTKHELLGLNKDGSYPKRQKRSTIGPGHDGAPKKGFHAKPGEGLPAHHAPDVAAHAAVHSRFLKHVERNDPDSINPRAGKMKRLESTPHSWGNKEQQIATAGLGGMGHATTAALSDAARLERDPTAKPPPGKRLSPVTYTPGMKPRDAHTPRNPDDWGRRILADAVRN
jgi:hypothetical protein